MFTVLRPDKDAYITDRVVRNARMTSANVGSAGSLDLFKLYGYTSSGSNANIELSRLLIHFDLDPLRELVAAGAIDTGHASFNCKLKLFDVYGGQPTPVNFTVVVHPLSRSFEEGLGRDVVYYADKDVCNFLSGSRAQGQWLLSGCALSGGLPGTVDYVTASTNILAGTSLESSQFFTTGEEDLDVDVTLIVSATLAGLLPDEGFRVALDDTHELDQRSYFVKRFASRSAYNEAKRPRLTVRYDDSIQDDTQSLYMDSPSYIFLYNHVRQTLANIVSGSSSTPITGSNSIILKLATEISGGWYTLAFTGSQHNSGINYITGVYSASVTLSSTDTILATKLAASGSIKFTPIWGSLDGTVAYLTGSTLTARPAQRGSSLVSGRRITVSVNNIKNSYGSSVSERVHVHLFDASSPVIIASRLPVEMPSAVVRDVHYQIRDASTGNVEIPFDTTFNSTRLSNDANGMYFMLNTVNLTNEHSYVVDIMIVMGTNNVLYKSISPTFKVSDVG